MNHTTLHRAPIEFSARTATSASQILLAAALALVLAATGLFVNPASAQGWNFSITGFGGKTIVGSGKAVTEPRITPPFNAISIKGAADVAIRQSNKNAVEVFADDNIAPLITTEVQGQTLVIGFKEKTSVRTKTKLVVRVDVATLTAIGISGSGDVTADLLKLESLDVNISGSGDVRLNDLTAANLNVSISGSGDFTAAGSATKQRYAIAGSGDIRSSKLQGTDVTVSIAGSGDASVWATGTLTGSVLGSGDIRYTGNATLNKSVLGSGSISKL
ncbi:MAG: DUF2807 domain-containing protein [Betaproteobacteria bacterium]|nr:MAG: DUF2807 domain-containing protein [Betaproteobacteria bacterium]TAG46344.1 MAG: DUF2807 domain-containing protein [Betaproteobacteria bacterium]